MSWTAPKRSSFARQQAVMFVLMGLMAIIFILQLLIPFEWQVAYTTIPADMVESWNRLRAGQAGAGDLWSFATMITYAFLHGSLIHLSGNLLFFWIFGALINQLQGWRWLLITVLLTALAGSLTYNLMNPESWGPLWGASGVVSGFMGAYLGLSVRWQLPDPHIWPIARPVPPMNLVILAVFFVTKDYYDIFGGTGSNIAYGAHVGGFTMGLFLTSFFTPRPAEALRRR